LIKPQVAVLLIVPAIPFGSLKQLNLGGMNFGATEVLVLLVLAAWLARMVVNRAVRVSWPPLALPLALFIGVTLLSLLNAVSLQHGMKEIAKWVEVLILYVMVANEVRGNWTRMLIFVMLGTGALVALHGIYQFLFQVGPEGFVLFGRYMRAHGTFDQPNPFAGYLGLVLPIAAGLVVAAIVRVGNRVGFRWLVWAAGTGSLMVVALIMSWSRGAWIGFAVALAVMSLAIVVRSGRAAFIVSMLVVVGAFFVILGGLAIVPESVIQRISDFSPYLGLGDVRGVEVTDANFAVVERVAHWQAALKMWADRPWLGIGIGNYGAVYGRYALPLWPMALGHAHNYYLNIGAETGVVGIGAYLLLWGAALVGAWTTARSRSGWSWGVALGVLGVLVHLSVQNLVDYLYVHSMYLQVALLLGIQATLVRENQTGSIGAVGKRLHALRPNNGGIS